MLKLPIHVYSADPIYGNVFDNYLEGTELGEAIYGYEGDDTLLGLGGNDGLYGGDENDSLYGGNGDDRLLGGEGNDFLDGGSGIDDMEGGNGNDIYVVDSYFDKVVEYANGGVDQVWSWLPSYTLGFALNNLLLDGPSAMDGTGNSLDNHIYGNNNNNILEGMGGNDTLYGVDGNDTLDGGTGGDTMYGGSGHDLYVVDSDSDVVVEGYNEGTDTVRSLIADYTLGSEVENLILYTAAAINGTGNSLDNNIYGNGNNNTLSGGYGADLLGGAGGNDNLDGGLGDDTMYGGLGNDWYVVNDYGDDVIEYANQGNDTVSSYLTSYSLDSHVENLVLAASWAVNGNGNNLDNVIVGNGNDNHLLFGAEGDDTVHGLDGNDLLDGGSGDDTLLGGEGDDTLTGGGYDNITGDIDDLTGGGGGDLFVLGNDQEMFYGGAGFAKIRDYDKSEGDSIFLHGSLDEYTLYKGGNYYGGAANDTVIHKDGDWIGVLVDTTNFSLELGGWT